MLGAPGPSAVPRNDAAGQSLAVDGTAKREESGAPPLGDAEARNKLGTPASGVAVACDALGASPPGAACVHGVCGSPTPGVAYDHNVCWPLACAEVGPVARKLQREELSSSCGSQAPIGACPELAADRSRS